VKDYKGFQYLEEIIKDWAPQIDVRKPLLIDDKEFMDEVLDGA